MIKICGIRRLEDAMLAVDAGADAIGLLVGQEHRSPDFITPAEARFIVSSLPDFIAPILVTHLTDPDGVCELIAATGVQAVQIHGDMSPGDVGRVRQGRGDVRIFKAIHVTSSKDVTRGDDYRGCADGFVLDTIDAANDQIGGTGKTHDWKISRAIVERFQPEIPVLLAGGLNPENVAAAIAAVRPAGVDVNSGTKGPDGFKDPLRVRTFVAAARRALDAQKQAAATGRAILAHPINDFHSAPVPLIERSPARGR